MSKDPAFLFYHQDFFTGVSDMTNEEVGAYIKCLCVQASKNGISEKHMSIICQSHEIHNLIKSKFVLNVETNLLENIRLKNEIEKRRKYSESRSINRKKTFIKPKEDTIISKSYVKHMKNISKSYVKHMENENENEIEIEIEIEDVIENKKPKIPFEEIIQIFNSVCVDLPRVEKLTELRKKNIESRVKENSLEVLGDVFRQVSESDFLCGKKTDFKASFDWIMKPANFVKILEGNYKNNKNGTGEKSNAELFSNAMQSETAKNFRFK